jgi:hypothetical protein
LESAVNGSQRPLENGFLKDMSITKLFRSSLMTGLLVVLLLSVGHMFLSAYQRYVVNQDKKAVLIRKAELLNHRRIDTEKKWHDILAVNRFIKSAQLLGLVRKEWEIYHVDIQDSVTFTEMKNLLSQCTNGDAYYFKPISFQIKSTKAMGNKEKPSGITSRNQKGDILMTLKGAFMVKNKNGISGNE